MGVNLAKKGFGMMVFEDDATTMRPWLGSDSLALAATGFTFLLFFLKYVIAAPANPCKCQDYYPSASKLGCHRRVPLHKA